MDIYGHLCILPYMTIGLIQLPIFVRIYKNRLDCEEHIIMITKSKIHIWTTRSIAVMTEEIVLTYALVDVYCFSSRQKKDSQISVCNFVLYICSICLIQSHICIKLHRSTRCIEDQCLF